MNFNFEDGLEAHNLTTLQFIRSRKQAIQTSLEELRLLVRAGKYLTPILAGVDLLSPSMAPEYSSLGKLAVAGGLVTLSGVCAVIQHRTESIQPAVELDLRAVERVIDRRVGLNPELNA